MNTKPKERICRLEVRLKQDEYTQLQIRANKNKMTVSDYVRRTVFAEKFTRITTDFEVYLELKALHADLNRMGNFLLERKVQDRLGLQTAYDTREAVARTVEDLRRLRELTLSQINGKN